MEKFITITSTFFEYRFKIFSGLLSFLQSIMNKKNLKQKMNNGVGDLKIIYELFLR
mgnify:CR=1 FL=1